MSKVKIVAAISSLNGITLYDINGKTTELSATGWKTDAILKAIAPALVANKPAEIDLDDFSAHAIVAQKTNGKLSFFSKLKKMFVGEKNFVEVEEGGHDTVTAVINGKYVPGVEAIQTQIEHAVQTDNIEGLQRFMERLAEIETAHTVQELLNFMRKGDLPIAKDGSIIAYKSLYRRDGKYIDCHSRQIKQYLGDMVIMARELVDPSRRNECSSGFHVGRRAYMGNFSGDVIVLVKIAPEDVVAVPFNEPNKMRVCAYHIVAELNTEGRSLVMQHRPMTTDAASAKMLADVIAGDHIGVTGQILVAGASGTEVTYDPEKEPTVFVAGDNGKASALDDVSTTSVTPKQVRELEKEIIRNNMKAAAMSGDMGLALSIGEASDNGVWLDDDDVEYSDDKDFDWDYDPDDDDDIADPEDDEDEPEVAPQPVAPTPPVRDTKERDAEVLKLIAGGWTQRQVCDQTGVSTRTIRRIIAANK